MRASEPTDSPYPSRQPYDRPLLALICLAYLAITALVSDHAFFWDTLQLGSRHAHWFYDNDFRSLMLPVALDSGHPPAFGLYLALLWKIFGRSLAVSHFAMLPCLIGIALQAHQLVGRFVPRRMVAWGTILVLAEPTLLAQSVLVSPDVALIFFYLLCVNAFLGGRRRLLAVGLIGLGFISLRGVMSVVAVFTCDLLLTLPGRGGPRFGRVIRVASPYLPATLLVSAWLGWHYLQAGWVGYHPDSPWAESFRTVGAGGVVRNVAFLLWRLIDFGRVFLWLAAAGLLFLLIRRGGPLAPRLRGALVLFLVPLAVYSPSLVSHAHLTGHRYLLAVLVLFGLFVFTLLDTVVRRPRRWILYAVMLAGLGTGHLWKYPETISTGWDSTLAHLPFYGLRERMLAYVDESGIAPERIGSEFPCLDSPRITDLADDRRHFRPADLSRDEYVFYASVMNSFTDEELESLETQWTKITEFRSLFLRATLYRRVGLDKES